MLDADLRARGVSKPWVKCWVPRVCPAAARADRQSGPATRRQMIRTPLTQAGRTPWVDSEAGAVPVIRANSFLRTAAAKRATANRLAGHYDGGSRH